MRPLVTEFLHNLYKSSVRTSQETCYISITETNRLMLFRGIPVSYCENHTPIHSVGRILSFSTLSIAIAGI
jgi:hypothetical protein